MSQGVAVCNCLPKTRLASRLPTSTIDLSLPDGDRIPIEERDPAEVLDIQINGERVVPIGAKARNPAFDITPHQLLTAIVTEQGVITPPFATNLPRILRGETS